VLSKSRKTVKAGPKSKPVKKHNVLKILALLFSLAIIAAVGLGIAGLVVLDYFDSPTGSIPEEGSLFTIIPGESATAVARRLHESGYIRSDVLFRFNLKIKNQESMLKSGTYRLNYQARASEIQALFIAGHQVLVKLVLPEGRTLQQVAQLIERTGIAPAKAVLDSARDRAFLASLDIPADSIEGYLYPDTYYFVADTAAADVLRFLVTSFRTQLAKIAPESVALSALELHQRVILASIVEREYRLASEAPLMAGVFYNRLQKGMLLQSCATVVYVITEELGRPHPDRLFNRDLELNSAFNTYKFAGLPPAPICNPGQVALRAVMYPEVTRYLFFRLVDEKTGRHYFSESFNEHIGAAALIVKP
jgi:UPF0755 protein